MPSCKPDSDSIRDLLVRTTILVFLGIGGAGACGQRTLTVVDTCSDDATTMTPCKTESPLRTGLIGLWHLDSNALDDSGNSNNGTVVGLDQSAWVSAGRLNGALDTKGLGYISVPRSTTTISITGAITIAGWIYWDGTIVDYGTLLSRQISPNLLSQHFHLAVNMEAKPSAFIVPANSTMSAMSAIVGPKAITAKTWIHLAVTYDGATATLYQDGVNVKSDVRTGSFAADTTPIILGGNGNGPMVSERFPGRIDEIVLYKRALSEEEIAMLYAGASF